MSSAHASPRLPLHSRPFSLPNERPPTDNEAEKFMGLTGAPFGVGARISCTTIKGGDVWQGVVFSEDVGRKAGDDAPYVFAKLHGTEGPPWMTNSTICPVPMDQLGPPKDQALPVNPYH